MQETKNLVDLALNFMFNNSWSGRQSILGHENLSITGRGASTVVTFIAISIL